MTLTWQHIPAVKQAIHDVMTDHVHMRESNQNVDEYRFIAPCWRGKLFHTC